MEEVLNYLRQLFNNKKRQRIVLANSAGPDSMSLLALLLILREDFELEIISAHVNHKVREESDEEALFLKQYCNDNNIIFEGMEIKEKIKDNFQMEARKIRYEFFDKIFNKYKADYIFTAHHGDDLVETILMRIARGSTLKGYGGFQIISDNLVRPLIYVSKEEILEFNKKNNIPYKSDKSNLEDDYTRNRFRNHILPFLKEEDKNINRKFLKFSELINDVYKYINNEVEKVIREIFEDNVLIIDDFKKVDKLLQKEIIYNLLEKKFDEKVEDLQDVHVDNIINLIYSDKSNASIDLPRDILIKKSYNELRFELKEVLEESSYLIEFKNEVILPNNKRIFLSEKEDLNDNFVLRLLKSEVKFPLYIRNRRDGDKMYLRSLGYRKIKDIYIDLKIPIKDRETQGLLVDRDGEILWILGLKKSKFGKKNNEKYDIIIKYD